MRNYDDYVRVGALVTHDFSNRGIGMVIDVDLPLVRVYWCVALSGDNVGEHGHGRWHRHEALECICK